MLHLSSRALKSAALTNDFTCGTFVTLVRSENRFTLPEATMKNRLAIALLGTALIGGAAYAQSSQPSDRAAPATTSPAASSDKMMLKGKWRASKLMGLDVYNEANEKLGDINELIL